MLGPRVGWIADRKVSWVTSSILHVLPHSFTLIQLKLQRTFPTVWNVTMNRKYTQNGIYIIFKFMIVIEYDGIGNLIKTNPLKNGKKKYNHKLTELDVVTTHRVNGIPERVRLTH